MRTRQHGGVQPAGPDPPAQLVHHDRVLPGLDPAAELQQRQARVGVVGLEHVVGEVGVRQAQGGRDLEQGAVLERLVGLAAVGRARGLHLLARLEHDDLARLHVQHPLAGLVALGPVERGLGCRRGDEQRVHRRHLLPVELGIVVLVEQEQLHDPGGEARDAAQLAGIDRVHDVQHLGRRHPHASRRRGRGR